MVTTFVPCLSIIPITYGIARVRLQTGEGKESSSSSFSSSSSDLLVYFEDDDEDEDERSIKHSLTRL